MILLDHQNKVLQETVIARLNAEKREVVDVTLADFDSTVYHIHTPDTADHVYISMRLRCYKDLVKYGADKLLQAQFGSRFQSSPESGWDVTLLLDLAHAPDNKDEFAQNVGNMKRTCISAPFEIAFAELDKVHFDKEYKVEQELMSVHYREQETMWIRAQQDRVTVIFSTVFNEETDRVFGKVFLQEFVDARKQLTLQNAPQVISSKEAPLELRHLPNLSNGDDKQEVNYITFVLFPRHFAPGPTREATISQIHLFRDYLHYHIKCCKAYMHSRMRKRVSEFLKVLNRAKPETAKKTAASKRAGQ